MTTFRYFAYGSNMLTSRLQTRCQSAVPVMIAHAPDHSVAFHKPSVDKSGKATLVTSDGTASAAAGVVFEILMSELTKLDNCERGYSRDNSFSVTSLHTGECIQAYTYFAEKLQSDLKPYDWYLALVIAGLYQHDLGEDHASGLREIEFDVDSQTNRATRLAAIKAMDQAGIPNYESLLTQ